MWYLNLTISVFAKDMKAVNAQDIWQHMAGVNLDISMGALFTFALVQLNRPHGHACALSAT